MRNQIIGVFAIICFACSACGGGEGQQISVSPKGSFIIVESDCSFVAVNEIIALSEEGQILVAPQQAELKGDEGSFVQDEDGPITASVMVDDSLLTCNAYYSDNIIAAGCHDAGSTCYIEASRSGSILE